MTRPAPPPRPDDEADQLQVFGPARVAAGLGSVRSTMSQTAAQLGLRRGTRLLVRVNQPEGFDCPGCAWPEPAERSHLEFCENGAKALAEEATVRRCGPDFFASHPVAALAEQSDHWLGQQGRLTHPMMRTAGDTHYRPVAWSMALDLVADRLRTAATRHPDRAVFYTSGRTSNEVAFLYQLLARRLGTNNLPDCSNLCHESSGVALTQTIGVGKGSVTLTDLHQAELILVVGQNPGTNHPRMLSALGKAKANGAQVVAVNPMPEAGLLGFADPKTARGLAGRPAGLADHFLQIRVGADLALFQWLNRRLVELDAETPGVVDHGFVTSHTHGWPELAEHLAAVDSDALLAATGLPREQVEAVARLLADRRRIVICWAMGITQHRQAVATIREMVNTLLLRGAIGRPGAGVCPVRGHSNVQGDRTMGIVEKPTVEFLAALGAEFGFDAPTRHGTDVVAAIEAMARGDVDVFMAMGGNFLSASPDTEVVAEALARVGLSVAVSTKLNRSHLIGSGTALILPCLGRTEVDRTGGRVQRVTVEDSMSVVHASSGSLAPASDHLLSEVAIVAELGSRVDPYEGIDWMGLAGDYGLIRDHIEAVVPGFTDFNRRLDHPGGFVLPHPPRDHLRFPTPDGLAHLTVNEFAPEVVPPGHLLLQTVRSHDQFNTTIYGLDDRYRGISNGRRVVFVNPADLAELNHGDGDRVDVVSEWRDGRCRRIHDFRLVAYPVARGTCAAYFPEANPLVPLGSIADESRTPTSKSIIVRFVAT
ncbi:MAG: FdhF/YdeP family oxidoreductase [Microthrixaceae bacterium]|nr:FdhF/YdeP family oxidoreductase [Microthrixaceae bacterium]